ncbi:MAG: phosphate signaling complex protein PhoU [Candidatus Hermodarchaeota archaeon]
MSKKFHHELNSLKKEVINMGRLAKKMLEDSIQALIKLDVELAEQTRGKKEDIRRMDQEIEAKSLQLLTLFQPMAIDMRTIACILKLITYITRIGRYGKGISNITIHLAGEPHVKKLVSLPHMSQIVCNMIDDALNAFESNDLSLLHDFVERDDTVDELDDTIFRECLTYMMEEPRLISRCARYIMISRYLERCGDHACKMAEKIHYMVNGEHIEIK